MLRQIGRRLSPRGGRLTTGSSWSTTTSRCQSPSARWASTARGATPLQKRSTTRRSEGRMLDGPSRVPGTRLTGGGPIEPTASGRRPDPGRVPPEPVHECDRGADLHQQPAPTAGRGRRHSQGAAPWSRDLHPSAVAADRADLERRKTDRGPPCAVADTRRTSLRSSTMNST